MAARAGGSGRNRRRLSGERRLVVGDQLPQPRVWLRGPRWRRFVTFERVDGRTVLAYSFEDDVRELILEELRPDVFAQWSDPRL